MRVYLNKKERLALLNWKEIPESLKEKINLPIFYYLYKFEIEEFRNVDGLVEKIGLEQYYAIYLPLFESGKFGLKSYINYTHEKISKALQSRFTITESTEKELENIFQDNKKLIFEDEEIEEIIFNLIQFM